MKGAQAYVNDQWENCGLSRLPEASEEAMRLELHFIEPRNAQFTSLFNQMSDVCVQHLREAYPGRHIHADPVVGSVVGDGSGDGITLAFQVGPAEPRG